ncbi:sensor histidine kinase [Cohnella soli]|uniref:histidine kinase n=1 Tax=Cohnella soli TaxID=425005 RepID=A0ABW0HJ42_9BACL
MNWTHRKRIVVSAVGLSLCAQLLLLTMGIIGAGKIDRGIEEASQEKLLDAVSVNVTTFLSQMNAMLSYLQSNELGDYVQSYLGFEDPAVKAQKTGKVNTILDQIRLSEDLIDSIYILGNFPFQENIVLHAEGERPQGEYIPNIADLGTSGLLPALQYYHHRPVVFSPGELTGSITASSAMNPEEKAGVRKFAESLEGHIVLTSGVLDVRPKSFIVVMVMKPHLLRYLVHEDSFTSFKLLDGNKKVLDQTQSLSGNDLVHYARAINPSGIQLEMSVRKDAYLVENKEAFIKKYILFFVLASVGTFIVTTVYSHYLILPFRKLSHRMKKQHLLLPLQFLPNDKVNNGILPSLSLRKKLFVLFFLSVGAPAISSGIAYYQYIHHFAELQMKSYVKQLTEQTSLNVHRQTVIYEDLINKLTVNQTFAGLLASPIPVNSNSKQLPDISFLQYPGINDISYFVLYNLLGTPMYSNQGSEFFNPYSLENAARKKLEQSENAIWVSNMKDLYNQPTLSMIKRVIDTADPGAKPIGIIQIVLNQSAFQSILPQSSGLYLEIDPKGGVVLRNDATNRLTGVIKQISSDLTKELFDRYLIVVFSSIAIAMLLILGLTRWLIRSIEHLKTAMELPVSDGRMQRRVVAKGSDEISDLVDSFNGMLDQINRLMDENMRIAEENSQSRMNQQMLLSLKTQAELKMLQLQINPHFLYNTLQSIGMRSKQSGDEVVGVMIYALADLFHYSISRDGNFVSLTEEIQHTRNYIAIQAFRFKDKFTVEWKISEEALSSRVLKFILQPLVENAISHGVLHSIREGKIVIEASADEQYVTLSVTDNGVGIDPQRLLSLKEQWHLDVSEELGKPHSVIGGKGGGLGLNNVYFRLLFIYHGQARMDIDSELFEGTRVRLFIPRSSE